MNYNINIHLDASTVDEMNTLLERKTRALDEPKDVIETFTGTFENTSWRGGIEADIKVVNGSDDSGPYVDAVLFHEGSEIAVCEPNDKLDGEYTFFYGDHMYTVHVIRGNPKVGLEPIGSGHALSIEGYGDAISKDGEGSIAMIDFTNGKTELLVWADINSDEPTHIISLEGAKESNRIPPE